MSGAIPSAFDRWGVDPRGGPTAITERMRELAEAEHDPERRARIRADWEALTLHPLRRLEAALDTFPETRPELGAPPRRDAARREEEAALDLRDLVPTPRLESALPAPDDAERDILSTPAAARIAGA